MTHPIDIHVGKQIRFQRIRSDITQQQLGEAIGVTFQQVQKYEKGKNRVSASRLFLIAQFLNREINDFFIERSPT